MKKTAVHFSTTDKLLQKLMDTAEQKCLDNIRDFEGMPVLVEGGGYEKIWLETQPMGGAMYAKRNLEIAVNNQRLFLLCQRSDGRIPGSIEHAGHDVIPQFNKFQGFCFPEEAIDVWYLTERDPSVLEHLRTVLRKFDDYLWKVRDSDGDGCLETWCRFDTGEDHAVRYGDAPDAWTKDTPPEQCDTVPIASMDLMSYSYACRKASMEISGILGQEQEREFERNRAEAIRTKIREYLWDDSEGALYDRDRHHKRMPSLIHNTLRAMYWGSISQDMANRFVREHLLNPREFWTRMPLPSVAANDPIFRNIPTNDWSGQCEALTYQRAIRALENYGFYTLIPMLGQKLFTAIGEECHFVQQFDPFTMKPSVILDENGKENDTYGPAILSVMEYCSRMYGVHLVRDTLVWGTAATASREKEPAADSEYEQIFGDQSYQLVLKGNQAKAYINGRQIYSGERGLRIVTDLEGNILRTDLLGEK